MAAKPAAIPIGSVDAASALTVDDLNRLSDHAHDPVITFSTDSLEAYLKRVGGAKGISVPDVLDPQQISTALYIGATSPDAKTEVPHWHPDQAEAYFLVSGNATMFTKYRWERTWSDLSARTGDLIIVNPEACHWFCWTSKSGLALVFKAPQRAGVGRFPAGKTTCEFCPHFNRGCAGRAGLPVAGA